MEFYTNFTIVGNSIGLRYYKNGSRITERIPYSPSLFYRTNDADSTYRTIFGQPVKKKTYDSLSQAYDALKSHNDIENLSVYGNNSFGCCFIADRYPGLIDWNSKHIKVAILDIETESKHGFPNPEQANEVVTAITYFINDRYYVFGCGEYKQHQKDIVYCKCKTEVELLKKFIHVWSRDYPDIITGWYTSGFDIPYLLNRMQRLLGLEEVKKLSPWKKFGQRTFTVAGKMETLTTISGIAHLDYMWLYKKLILKPRESFRLDYICRLEIGEGKVEIDNIRTIHETDFQKFIEYNIQDTQLIRKLDDKLNLLERAMALAYDAKVNLEDSMSQTRIWDNLIFLELKDRKQVIPFKTDVEHVSLAGAYNLEPEIGAHDWPVCFDVASLYPNTMLSLNISPETLSIDDYQPDVNVEFLLSKDQKYKDIKSVIANKNLALAANGHCFSRDREGFLTRIIKRIYSERKEYKSKQLDLEIELERVKEEIKKRKKKK